MSKWEERCYFDGIPDEVPAGIAKSGRAPSWKQIAIAILRNDLLLKELGFSGKESKYYSQLRQMKEDEKSPQRRLL